MIFPSLLFASLALAAATPGRDSRVKPAEQDKMVLSLSESETALFAGGHFWSLEKHFDSLRKKGVLSTTAGYSGGTSEHPTQKAVADHRESVQVVFSPKKINYEKLVEEFLRQTDPYDDHGQFCDQGEQYRSAIFFENENQRRSAEKVIHSLEAKLGKGKFTTALLPAHAFHPAEPLNQEFFETNPVSYKLYLFGCGREERLEAVWGG